MPRGTSRYYEAAFQRRLWTPASLRGLAKLYAWWDFSDESTLTITSGALVSVADKSGFGVTGTTPVVDPTYADPGIDCYTGTTGGQSNLTLTLPSVTYDFAAVATSRATAANYRVLVKNNPASGYPYIFEINTANVGLFDGAIKAAPGLTWPAGTLGQTYLSLRSQTSLWYGLNGSNPLVTPAAHDLGGTSTTPDVGAQNGSGGRGFGSLFETLFMAVSMPDDLRWKVEGYLAWKWSQRLVHENTGSLIYYYDDLVARLPASHPYKRYPPLI